jgi:DNA repair exonuclease SbcCD nuclease subunit
MAFTFLHTSDWHVGKPFGRFLPEQQGVLRQARLTAIDRLADAARGGRARHVLVAGDVYDQPKLPDRELRAPLGQMHAHRDIAWHIIPGNHDPAGAGSVWERAVRDGLPANVNLYLEPRPAEIAEACWLLPAPLAAKSMTEDPTAWMDGAATPAGCHRIGLAHGSIQGFGSEKGASIEIAPDRPRRAGLSYMALGDWHGLSEIGPRAAYSGTPEPDGFLDNMPGFALLVTLEGVTSPPQLQRRQIGEHRWLQRSIGLVRSSDLAALEGEIEGLGAQARRTLLSLDIAGRVTMAEDREVRARLDRLESRVFHLDRRLERMLPTLGDDDLTQLAEGPLRDIGSELSLLTADVAHPEQAVAARALRHLYDVSQAMDGGQP